MTAGLPRALPGGYLDCSIVNAHATPDPSRARLARFAYASIAAAGATIALKVIAWQMTDSTAMLSDAYESGVNLFAAVFALLMLRWAAQPEDEEHAYGHTKAEYFAAGIEGALILFAAVAIGWASIHRLIHPIGIEDVGLGLAVSSAASLINLGVGMMLIRVGRENRSFALEADGRHLMSDVLTSVGVIAGVAAVAATGWDRLDPIIALLVAANIVVTGTRLIARSTGGLMDRALPPEEIAAVRRVLDGLAAQGVEHHALRTRQSGHRSFMSVHILVPGKWSVQQGHDLLERVEADLTLAVPHLNVFTHLEPIEDPASFADAELRSAATARRRQAE